MKYKAIKLWFILFAIVLGKSAYAQTDDSLDDEEIYTLAPFEIDSSDSSGYTATATLAGTRVRTNLEDLATSISVVTDQFLSDTGATDSQSLLVYTTNTEVGGLYGNYAGVGNTQGLNEANNLTQPSTNTRVRGLDAADNTRNYFITDIPWDSFNVDRVDLQRGPNSILFGVGSPAGIINTGTLIPAFQDSGEIETRFASHGSQRQSFDYNKVIIEGELAVRVVGLNEHEKFKQKPAYEKDKRGYVALTYQPDLVENGDTIIRANYEKGEIRANRPRILPPVDQITAWWSGLGQRVFDPAWAWEYRAVMDRGNQTSVDTFPHVNTPWLGNEMDRMFNDGIGMFFNNGNSQPTRATSLTANMMYGINSEGVIDRGIDGFIFGRMMDVAAFNEYSRNVNAENPDLFPAAKKNFYKDIHMTDASIFDFYNKLIDGNNKWEKEDWEAYNVSLVQTFFNNRLGFEAVYDYQEYSRSNFNLFGGRTFVSVDVNTHTNLIPTEYPGAIPRTEGGGVPLPNIVVGGDVNPNVGRAYISGGQPSSSSYDSVRENARLTAFGELHGSDFFDENSWLANFIGRQVFTGLISRDERKTRNLRWRSFASDLNYVNEQNIDRNIGGYPRSVSYAIYLSDDLRNVGSPRGLDLPGVEMIINPMGQYEVEFFDSHWNAPGVDPSAPYTILTNGATSTQSENPNNYVGWSTMPVTILNAENGDIASLYDNAGRNTEVIDSKALIWQGYLFDGKIVPTYGWRRDEVKSYGRSGIPNSETGVVSIDFPYAPDPDLGAFESTGETVSWGVVAHSKDFLSEKLPYGTNVSLFYNKAKNFQARVRVGFDGTQLPNPSGKTEDYGFVVNTLNDRMTFKVTWYKTSVENADIPGNSPLGETSYYLQNLEAWGTASALAIQEYWAGNLAGMAWYSNYGLVDEGLWGADGWENAPFSDEALAHPSNVAAQAAAANWFATMPPQSFFDAYGLPINTALATGNLEDHRMMINGGDWSAYNNVGNIQGSGGGRINGLTPTMTIGQESKGVEFELQARPTDNWDITINASKTEASRTGLGKVITNWIEYQYSRLQGPAGDLRLWWGGDQTIRDYYENNVYAAYQFQLDANGQSAAEVRPWRANAVTNYRFVDGLLEGVNIGAAYRWQDDAILGYQLDDAQTKLDVTRPIKGGSESNIDVWIGYQRDIGRGLNWRVQLNLQRIGEDAHLVPVAVNPDGTVSANRIAEGMVWRLTNTISF